MASSKASRGGVRDSVTYLYIDCPICSACLTQRMRRCCQLVTRSSCGCHVSRPVVFFIGIGLFFVTWTTWQTCGLSLGPCCFVWFDRPVPTVRVTRQRDECPTLFPTARLSSFFLWTAVKSRPASPTNCISFTKQKCIFVSLQAAGASDGISCCHC